MRLNEQRKTNQEHDGEEIKPKRRQRKDDGRVTNVIEQPTESGHDHRDESSEHRVIRRQSGAEHVVHGLKKISENIERDTPKGFHAWHVVPDIGEDALKPVLNTRPHVDLSSKTSAD